LGSVVHISSCIILTVSDKKKIKKERERERERRDINRDSFVPNFSGKKCQARSKVRELIVIFFKKIKINKE
jgi:hypothetical protein